MEPNKEVIRKWVEALRSGEYRQGYGLLCRDGEYCCLGVLCELGVKEGLITKQTSTDGTTCFDRNSHILPVSICEWAGLEDETPGACGESLPEWNDGHKKTFREIADLIEAEYLKGEE